VQEPQDAQQTQPVQDARPTPAEQDVQHAREVPMTAVGGPRGRTLGVAALAVAAVVGVLAVGFALGSGSPRDQAATVTRTAGQPTLVSEAGWTSPDGQTRVLPDGPGGPGFRGGLDEGAISITAIDGSKLSLRTDNGWTRTIDATGATVTSGGTTVALSTLKVGDRVALRETRNNDGTWTITAIEVVQPSVQGTVASISGSTVTVTVRAGGTKTVLLTGSTTYAIGGKAATKDAVVAGARIVARGTLAADGTLTATSVEVSPAMAGGTVKEKGASSITLTIRDGSTVVVKVDSSTTYEVGGVTSPTLADVKVGALVMATGVSNADGSITATIVRSWAAGQDGGPGMGGWGMGGWGMGGWGMGSRGRGGPDGMRGWPGAPDALPTPSNSPSSGGTNG